MGYPHQYSITQIAQLALNGSDATVRELKSQSNCKARLASIKELAELRDGEGVGLMILETADGGRL